MAMNQAPISGEPDGDPGDTAAGRSFRLLVVDIDGTLLNRYGAIAAADREALVRAAAAGIAVSLSTGRVVDACRNIFGELALDGYHTFFDGALVADPDSGEEVYVQPVPPEVVREISEFVRGRDMMLDLYSATQFFVERENWSVEVRRSFFGLEPTIGSIDRLWQRERIIKATVIVRSPAERAGFEAFRGHFGDRLNYSWTSTPAFPDADFINIIAPGASKGRALRELASFLGVPLDQVAAIGDGDNDHSLLEAAGLGIAMGNSSDALKAAADLVVADVEGNGVAAAVARLLDQGASS